MRLFQVRLRRGALGAAIMSTSAGLWVRHRRGEITRGGTYDRDTLDLANNLMHSFFALAVIATSCVAVFCG